jgi:hypothetical protein
VECEVEDQYDLGVLVGCSSSTQTALQIIEEDGGDEEMEIKVDREVDGFGDDG